MFYLKGYEYAHTLLIWRSRGSLVNKSRKREATYQDVSGPEAYTLIKLFSATVRGVTHAFNTIHHLRSVFNRS